MQQRGLILVDGREARLNLFQRAGEQNFKDALLFVAEERAKGVRLAAEVAVEAANNFREIAETDGGLRLFDKLVVVIGTRGVEALHDRSDVLVAEVENPKRNRLR